MEKWKHRRAHHRLAPGHRLRCGQSICRDGAQIVSPAATASTVGSGTGEPGRRHRPRPPEALLRRRTAATRRPEKRCRKAAAAPLRSSGTRRGTNHTDAAHWQNPVSCCGPDQRREFTLPLPDVYATFIKLARCVTAYLSGGGVSVINRLRACAGHVRQAGAVVLRGRQGRRPAKKGPFARVAAAETAGPFVIVQDERSTSPGGFTKGLDAQCGEGPIPSCMSSVQMRGEHPRWDERTFADPENDSVGCVVKVRVPAVVFPKILSIRLQHNNQQGEENPRDAAERTGETNRRCRL